MIQPNSTLQDRYRIVRLLGQGGMGAVYEAIDQRVSCIVALKETLVGANAEARQAFQREAALLANLRHPTLPKVMDHFEEGEGEFLVMEFIQGNDLAELLDLRQAERLGPFPQEQVLRWADELLKLLEYLHTTDPPIVHRDIKPANLKITAKDEIFLLDFGLAKGAAGQMATIRTDQSVRGYTPVYAPLEQIHGRGTDPRSDLYSLAATLYHLLTGQAPLGAPTRFDVVESGRPDPLKPANKLNFLVSPAVAAVIQDAMALSRHDRPATAVQMRLALKAATGDSAESEAKRLEEVLKKLQPETPTDDPTKPLVTDKNVQFTVYAPQTIKPEKIYTMLAFAHLSARRPDADADEPDPIEEMKDQAARILGAQSADYRDENEASRQPVPRGGALTFVPIISGITFSPSSRSFNWRKSVHREEFDMWAAPEVDGQTLKGRLTVFLGSVVIAEVDLTVAVNSHATPTAEKIAPDRAGSARRVKQIFASYSHSDEQVVAELAHVAPIFGSRFLMDRTHLEPGEDRQQGVQRLIQAADAFQLFWSTNAMGSPEVKREIDYAVSLDRPGFILPTYWEEPLPRNRAEGLPPQAIDGLHFFRIYPGAISHATFAGADESAGRNEVSFATPAFAAATPEIEPEDAPTGELVSPVRNAPTGELFSAAHDAQTDELPPLPDTMRAPSATGSPARGRAPGVGAVDTLPTGIVECSTCAARYATGTRFCGRCGSTNFRAVGVGAPMNQIIAPPAVTSPTQSFAPPPRAAVPVGARSTKGWLMPIYAGAAIALLVMVVAPVWLMLSNKGSPNLTRTTSNANSNANSNSAPDTNSNATNSNRLVATPSIASSTPIAPKLVNVPPDLLRFIRSDPGFEEPVKVAEVDLNGDGIAELLVQYERCGSGGCTIHLFQRNNSGFKEIGGELSQRMYAGLGDNAHGSFVVGPNVTRGYLDLKYVFQKRGQAEVFKFNGREYQAGR